MSTEFIELRNKLAENFRQRAINLNLKGKARDAACLNFWCGAACVNEALTGLALLISIRGYSFMDEWK
jgi:hypothetical protein